MNIVEKIGAAKQLLESCSKDLKEQPSVEKISTLLDICRKIDMQYQELCYEFDDRDGCDLGETYNRPFGPNIEFYIEADDWHEISLALRELD